MELWKIIPARGYLSDWLEVAVRPDWRLERNTVAEESVQIRGEWHFLIDRQTNGQKERVQAVIGDWLAQARPAGGIQKVFLLREADDENGTGTTVRALLLAQVHCDYRRHIRLDDCGVPWLKETQIKVREVVLDHLANQFSIEQILNEHPGILTLEQIHAAFTYFDNHREQVLAEIEAADRFAEEMRQKMGQPPAVAKLLTSRK